MSCDIKPVPVRKTRRTQSFEPCGAIIQMISLEMNNRRRTHPQATKAQLFEDCIASTLGTKYPELLDRFKTTREVEQLETDGVAA
jgi:hypothetical protein